MMAGGSPHYFSSAPPYCYCAASMPSTPPLSPQYSGLSTASYNETPWHYDLYSTEYTPSVEDMQSSHQFDDGGLWDAHNRNENGDEIRRFE